MFIVQGVRFKTQPNNLVQRYRNYIKKNKSALIPRPMLTPDAQKLCGCERVFILEHYLASKSFAAVREPFTNAYPDKEVKNKTSIH
jgi:hypothetical protein